jgi:hypothetical protein
LRSTGLADGNCSHHPVVQLAEVRERASLGEGEREALACVEDAAVPQGIGVFPWRDPMTGGMRLSASVHPRDRGPDGYCQVQGLIVIVNDVGCS